MLLGAHMSISGGVHTAFERGKRVGCTTMQIFAKNNTQWKGKPLTSDAIANYKIEAKKTRIRPVVVHSSYLINLCARDKIILKKSRNAFLDELQRCRLLGIPYLVFHPGSHVGQGEKEGLRIIADSLNLIHERTKGYRVKSVVEVTAGQGSNLGYRFEQIRELIDLTDNKNRMGVCLDTCHVFAAGYDISTEEGYEKTIRDFDDIIGLKRLKVIHLNDSKGALGSRLDRHEHIGKGNIGDTGFRLIMNDKRFEHIPKILETPKGEDMREDRINLRRLRSFIRGGGTERLRD
jgi:deoxyribonuclease IV